MYTETNQGAKLSACVCVVKSIWSEIIFVTESDTSSLLLVSTEFYFLLQITFPVLWMYNVAGVPHTMKVDECSEFVIAPI
jgi:hypothetical protein